MDYKDLIEKIYNILGKKCPKSVEKILSVDMVKDAKSPSEATSEFKKGFATLHSDIANGLILSLLKGTTFTQKTKIKQNFGKSIEERFPNASKEFLDAANAYWTFKIALSEIINEEHANTLGVKMLNNAELEIASIFFPTPGTIKLAVKEREKAQREILGMVINLFKLEYSLGSFIKGNPYLAKKKIFGLF